MKKITKFIPEGFILSLINLALLPIFCDHYEQVFRFDNKTIWYIIVIIASLLLAFLTTKIKNIEVNKRKWIIGIYTFIPFVIYMAFNKYDYCYCASKDNLIWIFLIDAACWILLRYEVDEVVKPKEEQQK